MNASWVAHLGLWIEWTRKYILDLYGYLGTILTLGHNLGLKALGLVPSIQKSLEIQKNPEYHILW